MLQIEVSDREHWALVNRLNDEVEGRDLRGALRLLDTLRDRFLDDLPEGDAARDDVVRIACEQRLDILLQAVLKGTTRQRAAATLLILQGLPGLLSAHSLDYLRHKIAGKGAGRLV